MSELKKMSANDAIMKADRLLEMLIQHQPGLFAHGLLQSANTADNAAKALAGVRLQLITELMKQPGIQS